MSPICSFLGARRVKPEASCRPVPQGYSPGAHAAEERACVRTCAGCECTRVCVYIRGLNTRVRARLCAHSARMCSCPSACARVSPTGGHADCRGADWGAVSSPWHFSVLVWLPASQTSLENSEKV